MLHANRRTAQWPVEAEQAGEKSMFVFCYLSKENDRAAFILKSYSY